MARGPDLVLAVVAGCGGSVSIGKPDELKGAAIAKKANAQLEKQNPQIVHGKLTCADVKYEKGATTRCLRTVDLDQGRRVKIGASVTITDTTKGGHYQIVVDKQVQEFGELGPSIEQDLATQYAKKFRTGKPGGDLPGVPQGRGRCHHHLPAAGRLREDRRRGHGREGRPDELRDRLHLQARSEPERSPPPRNERSLSLRCGPCDDAGRWRHDDRATGGSARHGRARRRAARGVGGQPAQPAAGLGAGRQRRHRLRGRHRDGLRRPPPPTGRPSSWAASPAWSPAR